MNRPRFSFPGFKLTEQPDNEKAAVERGEVTIGGVTFTVDLILPHSAPVDAVFLCASVARGNTILWRFKDETFSGRGHLAKTGDEVVITLVGRRSRGVERVIPLFDLQETGHIQRNVREIILLKRAAADFLDTRCILTPAEQKVAKIDTARKRAEEKEVELQRERTRLEGKLRRRIERREAIMARETISIVTTEGQKRYGVPVTRDEWVILDENTFVILVDSVDEEDKVGKPVESFIVKRQPGKGAYKFSVRSVADSDMPNQTTSTSSVPSRPEPVGSELFEINDEPFNVPIFKLMKDVRVLRDTFGLNGGAKVAVPVKGKGGKFTLFGVHQDRIDTIGEFKPME